MLSEDREEQKYPKWIRYLGVVYGIVLFWTTFSLPPMGYDFDSALLVIFVWLPVLFGAIYILEKPEAVRNHLRALRILITLLVIHAMFWGILLSYAFME